jgi:nucleoside-diphosphate-sugar epimerase
MNKILVTGGSGLLGNELIHQLLQQGNTVRAIINRSPILIQHPNLEIISCDLLDVVTLEDAMQNITQVYHCAGFVNFSKKNKEILYKLNTEATSNLVNAALRNSVQKLVHVSSIAAIGRTNDSEIITEEKKWTNHKSNSIYAQTKHLGEMEVWRGIAEGLNAVIVNPSIILGPGNWNEGSTAIFKKVHTGLDWYSEGINGFVDVRDVANAMIQLMNTSITAERFIVSGHNLSYKEVVFAIADAFKVKRPSKKIKPLLAELVWRLESIRTFFTRQEPLITKETVHTAQSVSNYDNKKLTTALANFEYHSFEDTIKYTCAVLQQNINK